MARLKNKRGGSKIDHSSSMRNGIIKYMGGMILVVLGFCVYKFLGDQTLNQTYLDDLTPKESTSLRAATVVGWDPKLNPLGIPPGKAQNLPSIRIEDAELSKLRNKYGGQGDKKHLGGFGQMDVGGINPAAWKHMIEDVGVKSFMDIGCGRGFSTSWFAFHGVDVICAEGSHDAVTQSVLPDPSTQVVEHDFSRGPWWPEKTYDVAWSVEFLEHVNLQFHYNYVTAFRKAALLYVTASTGAGWHHVEVHSNEWWIRKYESYGFKYDAELTQQVKGWARDGKKEYTSPKGKWLDGFYIRVTMMVFVNPVVAALPEHAHLFPEKGCMYINGEKEQVKYDCGTMRKEETPLAKSMEPLKLTLEMDDKWNDWIKKQPGSA